MKISFRLLAICFAALLGLGAATGCSREKTQVADGELKKKLDTVMQQMLARAKDMDDQASLKAAEPFHKIQGAPMELIGFSIPLKPGTNLVHVTFTISHFRKTPAETLAAEGLEDMQLAKTVSQDHKK